MRRLDEGEEMLLDALVEVTAGPLGTPGDTAQSLGYTRPGDDREWATAAELTKRYMAKLSKEELATLAAMPVERRARRVMQSIGLDPRNDIHWDTVNDEVGRMMRMRRDSERRSNAARHVESRDVVDFKRFLLTEARVNNPSEMTRDEASNYLTGLDEDDVLMNDIYITDAGEEPPGGGRSRPRGDDELYAGYTVRQALVAMGELPGGGRDDPRVDQRAAAWDEADAEFIDADEEDWWNREYDVDEVDIIDLFADDDGTIDGKDPQEWMEDSNYDLYVSIPRNIRRQDGKPFDEHDVDNVRDMVRKEGRRIKKYNPGIELYVRVQVGDTSADAEYMFV